MFTQNVKPIPNIKEMEMEKPYQDLVRIMALLHHLIYKLKHINVNCYISWPTHT